jgi:hypothetical protein
MKKISQIIFLLFIHLGINAQQAFNKTYQSDNPNMSNFAVANSVLQTTDSSILIGGMNYNQLKMSVIKINSVGDTLWTFTAEIGINSGNYVKSLLECIDSNYVLCGVSGDPILLQSHADLIKLDKNTGDTLWVRKIGLPDRSERFYSVKQTDDLGYIVAGLRYNVDGSSSDIYLVKTDSLGIPEWERTYGGANYDFANSVEIADDGGFMLFGTTYSYGEGAYNMYLVKTDSLGNQLWQKTYGGILDDYGTSMYKLLDGNYALSGSSYFSVDSTAAHLVKIDPDGNIIWEKNLKGIKKRQEFSGVKQLSTGELMICGNRQGDDLNNTNYGILYKLDETDGTTIWKKQYDYFQVDSTQHYFYGMDVCLDGGAVMAGMVRDLRTGASPGNSMWVVKTDCMGNDSIWDNACEFTIGLEEIEKDALFNLYPNPSTGTLTLNYVIPQNAENQSVSFYDATGKLVQKVDFTGEGQIQLNIDCSGFSNGVYQCVLVSDGEVLQQGKLVLIK